MRSLRRNLTLITLTAGGLLGCGRAEAAAPSAEPAAPAALLADAGTLPACSAVLTVGKPFTEDAVSSPCQRDGETYWAGTASIPCAAGRGLLVWTGEGWGIDAQAAGSPVGSDFELWHAYSGPSKAEPPTDAYAYCRGA